MDDSVHVVGGAGSGAIGGASMARSSSSTDQIWSVSPSSIAGEGSPSHRPPQKAQNGL